MRPSKYSVTILLFINVVNLWNVVVEATHADIMKTISYTFGRKVHPCLKELNLGKDILNDLLHYWEPNYYLDKREIGCAIVCASKKMHLVNDDGDILPKNVLGFAKASGADKKMAATLLQVFQACFDVSKSTDYCVQALDTVNCFRKAIQESSWLPHLPTE